MSTDLPLVTVIIAAHPEQNQIQAVEACRQLDYPRERLEILVARGQHPAAQRNAALHAAGGRLIYFLDDDSRPDPSNLLRAVGRFADTRVQMLGGPNLCPPEAPRLEQAFALVMGSWLAFGPSRARYRPVGALRATSEKELILCNLLARRDSLLQFGGFNEALYPNEENALMDRLQKGEAQLLYDPALIVYRRPRRSLKAFAKMVFTYGRGRAEQFRLHPTLGSLMNFAPPLFLFYLGSLAFLPGRALWILAFYGMALVIQAAFWNRQSLQVRIGCAGLVVFTHLLYGLGFWRGLFTPLRRPATTAPFPVVLEKIQFA